MKTCMHGYREPSYTQDGNCSICHHSSGQCDWGDCQKKATGVLWLQKPGVNWLTRQPEVQLQDPRPMCQHHLGLAQQLTRGTIVKDLDSLQVGK